MPTNIKQVSLKAVLMNSPVEDYGMEWALLNRQRVFLSSFNQEVNSEYRCCHFNLFRDKFRRYFRR